MTEYIQSMCEKLMHSQDVNHEDLDDMDSGDIDFGLGLAKY